MIASIAFKEARALVRDGRLWVLGTALALLFIAMLLTASKERARAEQERQEVEHTIRGQWNHQGDKNPHRAAHFGLYAFKPKSALSAIEPGVDMQVGQALWLEPHKRSMAIFSPAADAAPSMGLGAFTPSFVLLALVPLLLAVLGHGAVTYERELGTLRMLHACGARGRSLVLGKWIGLCAGLAIVLAPALLVSAWALVHEQGLSAAMLLLAALAAYYAAWGAVTVCVSAHCSSSRAALLVLTALWVAWVFVVPRLAASAVERMAPLPTGEAFWHGVERDILEGLPGDAAAAQRMRAFDAQLLAENGVARLQDLPFGANAKRRLFRDAYSTKVHALHFAQLGQAQLDQQRMLRWLTVVTPYPPMHAVSAALAGTDLAHRQHFEEAAERYRQDFTTAMDEWDLTSTKGVTSFEDKYAGDAQWQSMPTWRYTSPGVTFAVRAAAADWVLLAAWLGLAVSALVSSARRLNP